VSLTHWSWPDGPRPWPERREWGREEVGTHSPTPRRMPGWHGGAVPARPARGYPGMSSPSTPGAPHLSASTDVHTHTSQPPVVAQQALGEGSARHRVGGDRRRQKPRGNQPQISSERKLPSNPVGRGGRGPRGDCFAPGVGGGSHRSWPEWSGDGGGGKGSQRSSRGRGASSRQVWVGLTNPGPSRLG
jgi:hypothetical protein